MVPTAFESMMSETTLPALDHLELDRGIVLIGLMGAGKSSVGRRLAKRLDLPFSDADQEIEKAADCTIEEIFARHGEAAFRAGERRVIGRLWMARHKCWRQAAAPSWTGRPGPP